HRCRDFTGNLEIPFRLVEMRDAAVVQNRPFQRKRLSRWQAALAPRLVLQLLPVAVRGEKCHGLPAIRVARTPAVSGPAGGDQECWLDIRGRCSSVAAVLLTCYAFRMTARILDGTKIRDELFAELKEEAAQLAAHGLRPGLAAVLVGENPASQLYVKSKIA